MKKINYIAHIALWVFMFFFIFDYHFGYVSLGEAVLTTLVEIMSYATIFYVNYLILIPRFLKTKKYLWYVVSVVVLVLVYIFVTRQSSLEAYLYEAEGWRNVLSMVLNNSLFLLVSTLYWYAQQWQLERERQLQFKAEKLENELKYLKTQISPHFIFNTLNSIYALALQKHDNAAPMVSNLSKIMRYILYEGSANRVSLDKEIEMIRHYIDLQLLRKPESENVDFYVEGRTADWKIAPLLLINFVENCFKHGNLDRSPEGWIKVWCIADEKTLKFVTENSISPSPSAAVGGVGIENVKRQLELNYPENHRLKMDSDGEVFKVELEL